MLPRRRLLQSALAGLAVRPTARSAAAQTLRPALDRPRLLALARVVLPGAIGQDGQARAVDDFLGWLRDYRDGAERDHGYGVTALRALPASPAGRYPAQLDDLDRRAGGRFDGVPLADQQRIVTEAIEAAQVRDLPARPSGGHLATDLMSHYFRGARANDLAFGRAIGRAGCRDLAGSEARPAVLPAEARR
jgi:hypothetical protein